MAVHLNAFWIQKQSVNISAGHAECACSVLVDFCLSIYRWHCNFLLIFEDHLNHLDQVFKAVAETRITLTTTKCHFTYQSLLLLRQKVSHLGLSTHMEKFSAILNLDVPKNIHNLQIFFGMMVYFSSYIPFYAWIAAPLFSLLRKALIWPFCHQERI